MLDETARAVEDEASDGLELLALGEVDVERLVDLLDVDVSLGEHGVVVDYLEGVLLATRQEFADDLLGVFGDPTATGKSTSSDLAEGKRTLLIAEAASRLDPADQAELEAALGRGPLDEPTVDRVRQLLQDSGAVAAVRRAIERATADADRALAGLQIPSGARTALAEVAGYLGDRSS